MDIAVAGLSLHGSGHGPPAAQGPRNAHAGRGAVITRSGRNTTLENRQMRPRAASACSPAVNWPTGTAWAYQVTWSNRAMTRSGLRPFATARSG